jgi:hypothetical protein
VTASCRRCLDSLFRLSSRIRLVISAAQLSLARRAGQRQPATWRAIHSAVGLTVCFRADFTLYAVETDLAGPARATFASFTTLCK